jgi:hypothetical protein
MRRQLRFGLLLLPRLCSGIGAGQPRTGLFSAASFDHSPVRLDNDMPSSADHHGFDLAFISPSVNHGGADLVLTGKSPQGLRNRVHLAVLWIARDG